MELYNEVLEFILAHREEGYPAHKIIENFDIEFSDELKEKKGLYLGLQQHGKNIIIITFVNANLNYRTSTIVELEDYV